MNTTRAPISCTEPTVEAFLLTVSSYDLREKFQIVLYGATPQGRTLRVTVDNFRPLFFVERTARILRLAPGVERRSLPLTTMDGTPVDCLYFPTHASLKKCAQQLRSEGIRTLESDLHPAERFLMERMVMGGFRAQGVPDETGTMLHMRNPRIRSAPVSADLSCLSLDIETNAATGQLYSIACAGKHSVVFMIGAGVEEDSIRCCGDEKVLLARFFDHVRREDPDVLIGWNVVGFDLTVIQRRCEVLGMSLLLGRDGPGRVTGTDAGAGHAVARIPGRLVLDVPLLLRAYHRPFEEYSLDFVASRMLGKHKEITAKGTDKIREIDRLFLEDKKALAAYNLHDAVLTAEVFKEADLLSLVVARSRLCGRLPDRVGGSVAAFDYLYLPRLHRLGRVAIDTVDVTAPREALTGGHVMEPMPGLYENVLVFDFRSLYPSIITTFGIDPLALASSASDRIQGPRGPSFARGESILPEIITSLMAERIAAVQSGNRALSQAIKILMNSFYGVLGTTGCRFFSPELSQAITSTGQYLLQSTADYIHQSTGLRVIYGDTDSLFVLLGPGQEAPAADRGREIADKTTAWLKHDLAKQYGVDSTLVLQFETHFRRFFMPSLRGSQQGSKKRYCGMVEKGHEVSLVFKGLESARSDWTELARSFQHDLYLRIFRDEPVENFVLETVNRVYRGESDATLVYRKRVRKAPEEYTTHVPPHVQAARLLGRVEGSIAYVITRQGPQPLGRIDSSLDYDHYVETQLKPVADSILEWVGKSFDRIISGQQDLFAT